MAHIRKKFLDNKEGEDVPAVKAQSGRSRKLAEWQNEVIMTLDGRSGVRFRRVGSDELVIPGDYIKDAENRYEPWEGPRGFRAASFCKPVYRAEWKTHATKE